MGIVNTRSLTLKGSKVTGGAKFGGGGHKFLGRPVKGGIRGSNALQEGLIAGVKQARTIFVAGLNAGFKKAGSGAFNQRISAKPIGFAGAGMSMMVDNSIPGISAIDAQLLIDAAFEASTGTAKNVAQAKMSTSHTKGQKPLIGASRWKPLSSLVQYEYKNGQMSVVTPASAYDAGKLFALNFGTGPGKSLTGGVR